MNAPQTIEMTGTALATPRAAYSAITPMAMLDRAVEQGAGIEVLTKLMELQERWDRNQARKAFDAAIAAAKAEISIVGKNKTGHNDKRYADFAAYAAAIDPVISKHGLSYRFRTTQNGTINVTCVLSHSAGHSEENTLSGPADATGNKNAIQAIGSTLTYLQRYSLVQALGLAASDDDDGRAGGTGTIDEDQAEHLSNLIDENGIPLAAFLGYMKAESVAQIPASQYKRALHAIGQSKAAKVAK